MINIVYKSSLRIIFSSIEVTSLHLSLLVCAARSLRTVYKIGRQPNSDMIEKRFLLIATQTFVFFRTKNYLAALYNIFSLSGHFLESAEGKIIF